ncbi:MULTISPECIES: divalent metal cation transporter [unclassified Pseudomonas]|uniref:NRAMP family divalent metal transporter n=1 Tax=unclassified Pseudomonas TaxID=196821 RepID=UPI002AC9D30C|nr:MULTISPECIES: divalent metal cation transporter [unclassified Pseudomonas]MEB0044147.1 divalent metal cation transporter [Pseudomonas sp. Dout3]MEB0094916.1 divalent metal cation transporter [Pseudomonas sp. DC1.2]WPX59725.1 divalent metal cation transporter [Pseudomonas sp. DC1.2]
MKTDAPDASLSVDTRTTWLKKLGPGLITGAADDDPSGIATYSQAGAQFGLNTLWTLFLTFPLMVGIQMISARIGRVSGHGLATNIRRHYPQPFLLGIVALLLIANIVNIAADIAAMGDALKLLIGGPAHLYAVGFGVVSVLLQVFIPYNRYVRVLKWLTLVLLAYVGTLFAVHIPWAEVAYRTVWPALSWKPEYITMLVAVFGTTISPYLFFWQASQEIEEMEACPGAKPLIEAPDQAPSNFSRIKSDTLIGMGFSNIIAFFIMLTTALTLNLQGMTQIQTSAEAARALRPIAGEFAFWLFSAGIIGTGLLAIPVLAGSAAYAMAGAFQWKNSLADEPKTAKQFYGIITAATLLGVLICFAPIDPIKALLWSAVINCVMAVPIMFIMMLMASNTAIMGTFVIHIRLRILGWSCSIAMALAVIAMFWGMLAG